MKIDSHLIADFQYQSINFIFIILFLFLYLALSNIFTIVTIDMYFINCNKDTLFID